MKKSHLTIGLVVIFSLSACIAEKSNTKVAVASNTALSEQLIEGKKINTESCSKCHNTSVYAKTGTKIKSLESLEKRIQKCNSKTGAGLEEEDLDALTLFLNTEYYKLKK